MISLTTLITDIFSPAMNLIDELHTSEDERLSAKSRMLALQIRAAAQAQEYDKQLLESRTRIIEAEIGSGWLANSWRPISMLVLLGLVVADSFGLLAFRLSEDAWTLFQIGLGGYVVGRSGEKIVREIKKPAG